MQTENFERAARLRDMYRAIDEWTEKQQVLLDKPVTGVVYVIKQIESRYVTCLLKLFDGKVVDVVRTKERMHETDVSTLVASVKAELEVQSVECRMQNE